MTRGGPIKFNPPLGTLPVLQYCAPDQLSVDEAYQRSLDSKSSQLLIRKIAQHWDWGLCQPLIVARRDDNQLFVVDGQHRHAAARLRGDIWQLPCVVASFATMAAEAASFVALNQQRRPLSQLDLFKAALASGDEESVATVRAIEAAGLTLAATTNNQCARPGSISNTGGLVRCLREHGEPVLEAALRVLALSYPGEILRYAGTLFPGIAAIVVDELRLRTPSAELVERLSAMVRGKPQTGWYQSIQRTIGDDPNLNRRRAAEKVFREAWGGAKATNDAAIGMPVAARSPSVPSPTLDSILKPAEMAWCEQCDRRVSGAVAARCTDRFCKLKVAAA